MISTMSPVRKIVPAVATFPLILAPSETVSPLKEYSVFWIMVIVASELFVSSLVAVFSRSSLTLCAPNGLPLGLASVITDRFPQSRRMALDSFLNKPYGVVRYSG
jgi:hypothetical protein